MTQYSGGITTGSVHEISPASRMSIALPFKRAHVAAARIFLVVTRRATLISIQQVTIAAGAAIWVARINRRTARE